MMLQTHEAHAIVPACAARGELHIEKYFTQNSPARPFNRLSSVYIFGEVLNAERGNIVISKWYAKNVEGLAAGSLIGSSEIRLQTEGSYDISFCVQPPPGGWEPGEYSVEIHFNGLLAASHIFSVG